MNPTKWRNAQIAYDNRAEPDFDEDSEEYDLDMERAELEDWFVEAVKVGLDVQVKLGGDRVTSWNLSDYLGECVKEDKPLLLQACSLAIQGLKDCKHDAEAAHALRKFVESVAKHHAEEEVPYK
jgi:hypothetical protein